jgi:AcrR family transcriptional regulator
LAYTRTRRAIVEAAADLLRQGQQPTVAAAAAAAGVHRTTAYRYFPTAQSLLADAAGLMDAAVRTIAEVVFAEEAVFRNIVRATVDRWFAEQERPGPGPDPEAIRQTRRFE